MDAAKRAGWALLGVGLLFLLIAMAFQAWTGESFVTLTIGVVTSIVGLAGTLLLFAYKDAVISMFKGKDGD